MKPSLIFLVGPTAVGKTAVAAALAKKIGAEIVSCDSMQIYKGMDIITSKPPLKLQKDVPHYLVGVLRADREYDVSRYVRDAAKKIKEIVSKGRIPLVTGGTGLYMSALIDGIFKEKPISKDVRSRLYAQAQDKGSGYLHKRLQAVDPEAAGKIHPNDTKRIARALEVFIATGKPISYLQKQRKGLSAKYDIRIFCLDMPRNKLYERIDSRVEEMFKKGLVSEVGGLLKLKLSRTAGYAIGIRELKGYFEGSCGLDEARQLMKRNSRLYAKRQLTWFRKDRRIKWVKIKGNEKPGCIANKILKGFSLA